MTTPHVARTDCPVGDTDDDALLNAHLVHERDRVRGILRELDEEGQRRDDDMQVRQLNNYRERGGTGAWTSHSDMDTWVLAAIGIGLALLGIALGWI